jgi:hypothetical protein
MVPYVSLHPPGGGASEVEYCAAPAFEFDHVLQQTGTYTLVIQDCNVANSGACELSLLNVTTGPLVAPGELDGDVIVSGAPLDGAIDSPADARSNP